MARPFQFVERSKCPACAGTHARLLVDAAVDDPSMAAALGVLYGARLHPEQLTGGRYRLRRCEGCGLAYQEQVLDGDGLAELYGEIAAGEFETDALTRGLSVRRAYASQVEQAIRHFGAGAGIDVVDLGAGWGMWLDMARAYGCSTTAVEFATQRSSLVEASGHRVVTLDELGEHSFDLINAEQVVEHLVDPREVVGRLIASLRVGGLLRIAVPNGSHLDALLADPDWSAPKSSLRSMNAVAPLEHVNCFDPVSLERFVVGLGSMERFHYPVREFLEGGERARQIASAVLHRVRRPSSTMQLFRRV